MSLDKRVARELTSREIVKAVAGTMGGLSTIARPERIREALIHLTDYWPRYERMFRESYEQAVANHTVIPDDLE